MNLQQSIVFTHHDYVLIVKYSPTALIDLHLFPNTSCRSINKYKYPHCLALKRYLGSLISSDTRLFSQLYFNKKLTCVISATHITISSHKY